MADIPKRDDAITLVKGAEEASPFQIALVKERLESDSTRAALELKEYRELIEMRGRWSNWILGLLVLIVFSDVALSWFFGFGLIAFSSDYSFPIFIADGLLKTLGLAFIVVNFLFNKDSLGNGK